MDEKRKDCPMRHESGNCLPAGGFCTAVSDPICEALHNAFNHGEHTMANRLIANGVTVQQWIPVTERLPIREDANETESILAIHKADGYVGRWIWDVVARYPKKFTHWMPLPQPPKGE